VFFFTPETGIGRKKSGSGIRVADPDSNGSVDPDPESGSGSRRPKMSHKSRRKKSCFEVLDGLF
jgi:hypothetical protein